MTLLAWVFGAAARAREENVHRHMCTSSIWRTDIWETACDARPTCVGVRSVGDGPFLMINRPSSERTSALVRPL